MDKEQEMKYDRLVRRFAFTLNKDFQKTKSGWEALFKMQKSRYELKEFVNECIEEARNPGKFTKAARK